MTTDIQTSVLVATRNRANHLTHLLERLTAQKGAPQFEVIIADNGSNDDTANIVKQAIAKESLTIRYVHVGRPGKSRALNAALKLAKGDLIVFTDDDVQPYPDWLAHLNIASKKYPDCDVFGGPILVNLEKVPSWVYRSFNLIGLLASKHDRGEKDIRYGFNEYPFGPNMAVRRNCIALVDKPYPEHLGPGTDIPVGDEPTFLSQFSPPNATNRMFIASARVMHEVEKENVSFHGAFIRCYLAGRAHGMLESSHDVSDNHSSRTSTLKLIFKRLFACQSLRELSCISARYFGFLKGRREHQKNCAIK